MEAGLRSVHAQRHAIGPQHPHRRARRQLGPFDIPERVGDLYATVDVELPRDLTPEQRTHFEELRKLDSGTKNSAA